MLLIVVMKWCHLLQIDLFSLRVEVINESDKKTTKIYNTTRAPTNGN